MLREAHFGAPSPGRKNWAPSGGKLCRPFVAMGTPVRFRCSEVGGGRGPAVLATRGGVIYGGTQLLGKAKDGAVERLRPRLKRSSKSHAGQESTASLSGVSWQIGVLAAGYARLGARLMALAVRTREMGRAIPPGKSVRELASRLSSESRQQVKKGPARSSVSARGPKRRASAGRSCISCRWGGPAHSGAP